ncbi:MAG: hypothetical protein IME93_05110, partial [Proteobacteria bacterium]|nr:hypothetical protein [Pseudomonadota bacterium]
MKSYRLLILFSSAALTACAGINEQGTLAQLRSVNVPLKDEKIEGGIEKAMASYQHFLEQTPETAMTPEAIRRLADLKIERANDKLDAADEADRTRSSLPAPKASSPKTTKPKATSGKKLGTNPGDNVIASVKDESDADFEKRATASDKIESSVKDAAPLPDGSSADMNNVGAQEAIALYKQLLERFPMYERNDQVLYQMSRAYEDMSDVEEAMKVMNR